MGKFKGTKGKAFQLFEAEKVAIEGENYIHIVANLDSVHDAELFADALNTIQKCDLMPSELLEQRDELVKMLSNLVYTSDSYYFENLKKAQCLLTKIKTA